MSRQKIIDETFVDLEQLNCLENYTEVKIVNVLLLAKAQYVQIK